MTDHKSEVSYDEGMQKATELIALIGEYTGVIQVAGSLRRLQEVNRSAYHHHDTVGDIELVMVASEGLLPQIDALVDEGVLSKRVTRTTKSGDPMYHWGDRSRFAVYKEVKVDLFITKPHTWGYIYWLRTGPSKANKYLVTHRSRNASQYLWRPEKGALLTHASNYEIDVPTEKDFFALFGMPYIPPHLRSEKLYRCFLESNEYAYEVYRWVIQSPMRDIIHANPYRKTIEEGGRQIEINNFAAIALGVKEFYLSPYVWFTPTAQYEEPVVRSSNPYYNKWVNDYNDWVIAQSIMGIHFKRLYGVDPGLSPLYSKVNYG